jgi:hypothetical protein
VLTGLGTMAEQNANNVAITGGNIDGTEIGNTTPAQAVFTDVYVNNALTTDQITPDTTAGLIITNESGVDTLASFGVGLSKNVSVSPAGGDVTVAPTGTGKTTINSGVTGSIDNIAIGGTTAKAGTFTDLTAQTGVVSGSTTAGNALMRVTQTGAGIALLVEDDTNPDATPFCVHPSGGVSVGNTIDAGAGNLYVAGNMAGNIITAVSSFTGSTFKATNSAGITFQNASGTPQMQMGSGGGSNISLEVATNINPANAAVAISPTGTGSVTINPATAGSINNMSIGATTPSTGKFTSASVTGNNTTLLIENGVGSGNSNFETTNNTYPDQSAFVFTANGQQNFVMSGDVWSRQGTVGQAVGFIRIPAALGNAGTPSATVPNTAPLFFNQSTNTLNIYNESTSTWLPFVTGALTYAGTWNASTNNPTLTSSVGTTGNFYIVSVAGTTNLNGVTDWQVGDWAVFNGSAWQKVDNTDLVVSVNGQTGAVTITLSGLGAGTIATQNANSVAITGGAIDNTTIGATTPSSGKFTTATINDKANLNWDTGQNYINGETGAGLSVGANGYVNIVQTNSAYGGPTNIARFDEYGSLGLGTTTPNQFAAGYQVLALDGSLAGLIDLRVGGTTQGIFTADATGVQVIGPAGVNLVVAGDYQLQIDTGGAWTVNSSTGAIGQMLVSNGAGAKPSWSGSPDIRGGTINGATIGATTASTGAFTTLSASTSLTTPVVQATNSAGLSLKNSAGSTQMSMGAGGGDNLSINVSTNLDGANAQIDISPTGTGHVHMKPTGTGSIEIAPTNVGTMDNMTIGATTPKAVNGTVINATNGLVVNSNTVSASYSIPSGSSASSVGPMTVASGQTVTIASGSRWVVL